MDTPRRSRTNWGSTPVASSTTGPKKLGWRDLLTEEAVEDAINRRVQVLLHREKKTPGEQEELDWLIGHHVSLKEKALRWAEREQALKAQRAEGSEPGPAVASVSTTARGGAVARGGKKAKNEIGHLTADDFTEWLGTLFGYQLRAGGQERPGAAAHPQHPPVPSDRHDLLLRRRGAGRCGADRRQPDFPVCHPPRQRCSAPTSAKIAQTFLGVTPTGNPIVLSNGAELHFCSTNSNSAQSRSGNVYIDEYF